jgi:hypothetical protein
MVHVGAWIVLPTQACDSTFVPNPRTSGIYHM